MTFTCLCLNVVGRGEKSKLKKGAYNSYTIKEIVLEPNMLCTCLSANF